MRQPKFFFFVQTVLKAKATKSGMAPLLEERSPHDPGIGIQDIFGKNLGSHEFSLLVPEHSGDVCSLMFPSNRKAGFHPVVETQTEKTTTWRFAIS